MQRLALATAWVLISLLGLACQSEPQGQATPAAATTGSTAETPRAIPTAAQDKGVVYGILLQVDTKKPLTEAQGVDLFLGEIIHSSGNESSIASLDKTTAPRADADQDGRFVFTNVPPGEYALTVRGPVSEVIARRLDQSGDVTMTVVAGKALDLGTVYGQYP